VALPPGYDFDDFDAVCGLARGYSGWGAPHCVLPPILSDVHSLPARTRAMVDPYFDLYRGALVAVSAAADAVGSATDRAATDAGLGAAEWLAVLRALQQKAASSGLPDFVLTFTSLDEAAEAAVEPNLQGLLTGTASVATLIRPPQCRQTQAYELAVVAAERPRKNARDDMYEEDVWGQETESEDDEDSGHAPPRAVAAAPGREDEEAEMDFGEKALPDAAKKRRGGWPAGKPRTKKLKIEDGYGGDASAAALVGPPTSFSGGAEAPTGAAAAFAVPAAPTPKEMDAWEIRRLSRKKAREDALATQVRPRLTRRTSCATPFIDAHAFARPTVVLCRGMMPMPGARGGAAERLRPGHADPQGPGEQLRRQGGRRSHGSVSRRRRPGLRVPSPGVYLHRALPGGSL
jgi:hypothetical protein